MWEAREQQSILIRKLPAEATSRLIPAVAAPLQQARGEEEQQQRQEQRQQQQQHHHQMSSFNGLMVMTTGGGSSFAMASAGEGATERENALSLEDADGLEGTFE